MGRQEPAGRGGLVPVGCTLPAPPWNSVCITRAQSRWPVWPHGHLLLAFQGTKSAPTFHEDRWESHWKLALGNTGPFERNKGSAEDNGERCEQLCDKGVPGLEFPYLGFSSLWVCVPTAELATRLEPTSSFLHGGKKPYLFDTRENFTLIKLLFSSIPFVSTK